MDECVVFNEATTPDLLNSEVTSSVFPYISVSLMALVVRGNCYLALSDISFCILTT